MKYRLLKDTLTIKAGTIFEEVASDFNQWKELVRITPIGAKTSPQFTIQDIENFDEWFEEIKEESTDSIHWKPKHGAEYFWIDECGSILPGTFYRDSLYDQQRLTFGNVYRTEKEAEKASERRLAEVRLRRTSTFKPDFENDRGGWVVYYDYGCETLAVCKFDDYDAGEPVRYATREEAEKSIRENEQDWKIYFGIDPSDTDKS
nr:MAG TPA: hypothetical protein [Caudoviricetes sp.]